MRVGIAHHLGWAVAVTANSHHEVVDRRRIELIDPGLPVAPIHHLGGQHELHRQGDPPDDAALAAIVAEVRASARRVTAASLATLAHDIGGGIDVICLRAWPADFPSDISVARRAPYESTADSVMYRQVLAECAAERGWRLHTFEAAKVERQATQRLGTRADEVLHGPRERLGPPWAKDHRLALAATVMAV